MAKPPDKVFLQWGNGHVTWSRERVNDTDVEYALVPAPSERDEIVEELRSLGVMVKTAREIAARPGMTTDAVIGMWAWLPQDNMRVARLVSDLRELTPAQLARESSKGKTVRENRARIEYRKKLEKEHPSEPCLTGESRKEAIRKLRQAIRGIGKEE